jgi:hypothetical protein
MFWKKKPYRTVKIRVANRHYDSLRLSLKRLGRPRGPMDGITIEEWLTAIVHYQLEPKDDGIPPMDIWEHWSSNPEE